MSAGHNCGTCKHSGLELGPSKEMQRFCRRFPPSVSAVAVPVQTVQGPTFVVQNVAAFPAVRDDWDCGEYASKVIVP